MWRSGVALATKSRDAAVLDKNHQICQNIIEMGSYIVLAALIAERSTVTILFLLE
jgi:hypothetical protein